MHTSLDNIPVYLLCHLSLVQFAFTFVHVYMGIYMYSIEQFYCNNTVVSDRLHWIVVRETNVQECILMKYTEEESACPCMYIP